MCASKLAEVDTCCAQVSADCMSRCSTSLNTDVYIRLICTYLDATRCSHDHRPVVWFASTDVNCILCHCRAQLSAVNTSASKAGTNRLPSTERSYKYMVF